MKKFCVLFITIGILYSCENRCTDLTDEFVNNSGRKIEVISYKNYYTDIAFQTLSKKRFVENQTSLKKTNKICPPEVSQLDIGNLLEGDSIVIDFGDKQLRYGIKNLSSSRNPFYLALNNKDQYNFTYTLTPEDYANALP